MLRRREIKFIGRNNSRLAESALNLWRLQHCLPFFRVTLKLNIWWKWIIMAFKFKLYLNFQPSRERENCFPVLWVFGLCFEVYLKVKFYKNVLKRCFWLKYRVFRNKKFLMQCFFLFFISLTPEHTTQYFKHTHAWNALKHFTLFPLHGIH